MSNLYTYRAIVSEIYDGDTVTVDIDLGFGVWLKGQAVRLYQINAPELRGEEREAGLKSRDALRNLILGKTITLKTIKDRTEKYGRWLGVIVYDPTPEQIEKIPFAIRLMNVNEWLVQSNYAQYKEY